MKRIKNISIKANTRQLNIDFALENTGYKNPNIIARTPIFSSIKKGQRKILDEQLVADNFGVEIYQSGKQLDMADHDVFLWLVNLANENFTSRVYFSKYQLCKDLNKTLSKTTYEWLTDCFNRLSSTTIFIKKKNTSKYLSVHLVDALDFDFTKDKQYIRMGEEILSLYANKEFSFIDWSQRLTLKSFTKWLQGFLLSHSKENTGYYINTLQKSAGKTKTRPQQFINLIYSSGKELYDIGFLRFYDIVKKDKGLFFEYQRI